MADTLAKITSAMDRTPEGKFSISASRAPAGAWRSKLEARIAEIDAAMQPTAAHQIGQLIGQLFLRFPQSPAGNAEIAAYVSDLTPFPAWAINGAISDCLATSGAFAPSSPQIVAAAKSRTSPFVLERYNINKILSAEITPDRPDSYRAEMVDRIKSLSDQIQSTNAAIPKSTGRSKPAGNPSIDDAKPDRPLPQHLRDRVAALRSTARDLRHAGADGQPTRKWPHTPAQAEQWLADNADNTPQIELSAEARKIVADHYGG